MITIEKFVNRFEKVLALAQHVTPTGKIFGCDIYSRLECEFRHLNKDYTKLAKQIQSVVTLLGNDKKYSREDWITFILLGSGIIGVPLLQDKIRSLKKLPIHTFSCDNDNNDIRRTLFMWKKNENNIEYYAMDILFIRVNVKSIEDFIRTLINNNERSNSESIILPIDKVEIQIIEAKRKYNEPPEQCKDIVGCLFTCYKDCSHNDYRELQSCLRECFRENCPSTKRQYAFNCLYCKLGLFCPSYWIYEDYPKTGMCYKPFDEKCVSLESVESTNWWEASVCNEFCGKKEHYGFKPLIIGQKGTKAPVAPPARKPKITLFMIQERKQGNISTEGSIGKIDSQDYNKLIMELEKLEFRVQNVILNITDFIIGEYPNLEALDKKIAQIEESLRSTSIDKLQELLQITKDVSEYLSSWQKKLQLLPQNRLTTDIKGLIDKTEFLQTVLVHKINQSRGFGRGL